MKRYEALNLAKEAVNSGNVPRVHPNGFIQLDLDEAGNQRLHVWRNDLPRQKVYTPVHNHRFDFSSQTIVGSLTNIEFVLSDTTKGPNHREWVVRRNPESEETQLVATDKVIGLVAVKASLIPEGSGYEFSAGNFHETGFIHNTVTVIKKSALDPYIESVVLVPYGIEPDNSFTRSLPHIEDLKQKIEEALE